MKLRGNIQHFNLSRNTGERVSMTYAASKDSDLSAHARSLIKALVVFMKVLMRLNKHVVDQVGAPVRISIFPRRPCCYTPVFQQKQTCVALKDFENS